VELHVDGRGANQGKTRSRGQIRMRESSDLLFELDGMVSSHVQEVRPLKVPESHLIPVEK
jgi:hypothetical protein